MPKNVWEPQKIHSDHPKMYMHTKNECAQAENALGHSLILSLNILYVRYPQYIDNIILTLSRDFGDHFLKDLLQI